MFLSMSIVFLKNMISPLNHREQRENKIMRKIAPQRRRERKENFIKITTTETRLMKDKECVYTINNLWVLCVFAVRNNLIFLTLTQNGGKNVGKETYYLSYPYCSSSHPFLLLSPTGRKREIS